MEYTPVKLGVEVRGIDLKEPVSDEIIQKIKNDVHVHKLLIFKNQGVVSGQRQVEISKWFGELDSTQIEYFIHPKSPHPDIFRVSNDKSEGCVGVGVEAWHIDGSYLSRPFGFAIYHMVSVAKDGNTAFLPLDVFLEAVPKWKREKWDCLWTVISPKVKYETIHPLIYPHPKSGKNVMCFNLGLISSLIYDYNGKEEKVLSAEETKETIDDIQYEINQYENQIYRHQWEAGDFVISDNLAVGHKATKGSQLPASVIGLRVLHRTTIKGVTSPCKNNNDNIHP